MKMILLLNGTLLFLLFAKAQTPVAYYPFNGNANDAVGTLHGTVSGAILSTDRFGNASTAFRFDGVDDNIDLSNSTIIRPTAALTISAWFNLENAPGAIAGRQILSCTENAGYQIAYDKALNAFVLYVRRNGSYGFVQTPAAPYLTGWHYMAGTFDGRFTRLYMDGVLVGTDDAGATFPIQYNSGAKTYIGAEASDPVATTVSIDPNYYWQGRIDEVKIYNTALTATQVSVEFGSNYRSIQSGNWGSVATWEVFNGTSFVAAIIAPTSLDGIITIRTGHNVTVNSAVSADQVVIDAGATLTQTADFSLANGAGDDLVVNGTYDLQANMLAGPGNIVLQTGSQMIISSTSLKQFQNAAITNDGTINWQDGNIRFDAPNSSLINNGTFAISGNNTCFFNGGRWSITNNGTVTKTSTGTSNVTGILLFSNAGTLNCNDGNFVFGDGNAGGTFTNAGSLVFNTGTFSVGPGCIYNHNLGSTINGSGSFVNEGTANFNISQTFPSTISLSTTGNIAGAGDLIMNSLLTIQGNITGGGLLNIKSAASWNSGLLTRNVLIDAGQTLTLATATQKQLQNASITNNGTINWQNGDVRFDAPNSTLVNNGTFTVGANNATFFNGGRLSITNNGSFVKNTTGNSSLTGILLFSNAGSVNCNSGNLNFGEGNAGGIFTNLATGTVILNNGNFTSGASTTFNNNSGASIHGNGVFNFTSVFNNTGIIAPGLSPGLLTVNGQEPLSANSTLQIEMLNGTGAGAGHDQLIRSGNITLGGTLNVTVIGFVPVGTYTILNLISGTITGSFATVNIPAGTSILVNSTNVQLIVSTVLPLNLISFTGIKQNNNALLQWKTANEINVKHFEVQRSDNGQTFETIGTVAAGGSLYSLTDANIFNSRTVVFYKLKSIDVDGRFTYSNIIKLNKQTSAALTVYPNPVSDILTISGLKQKGTILLFNAEGKQLQQQSVTAQTITIDMSSYAKGFYLLQYKDEGEVVNQKIIKQ